MIKFDPSSLDSYRDFMGEDAKSFIEEIVESYKIGAPGLIINMKQAIQNNDPMVFVRAAHTLKSNSATIGAPRLAELAGWLENEGKTTPLSQLVNNVQQADQELEEILLVLDSYLQKYFPS
jgi:HPt (histidine-containing phosphotransfer) domain-containing protein